MNAKRDQIAVADFLNRLPVEVLPGRSGLISSRGYTRREFSELIQQLVTLRAQGTLTDEELSQVVAYVCSLYVKREIEERFASVLSRKLSTALLASV